MFQGHTTIKQVCDVFYSEDKRGVLYSSHMLISVNIYLFLYAYRDEERGKEEGRDTLRN